MKIKLSNKFYFLATVMVLLAINWFNVHVFGFVIGFIVLLAGILAPPRWFNDEDRPQR